MIPTIEDILRRLATGDMDVATAQRYIDAHIKLAADRASVADRGVQAVPGLVRMTDEDDGRVTLQFDCDESAQAFQLGHDCTVDIDEWKKGRAVPGEPVAIQCHRCDGAGVLETGIYLPTCPVCKGRGRLAASVASPAAPASPVVPGELVACPDDLRDELTCMLEGLQQWSMLTKNTHAEMLRRLEAALDSLLNPLCEPTGGPAPASPSVAQADQAGWFAGTEDADGNPLVTIRADELAALAEFASGPGLSAYRIDGDMVRREVLATRMQLLAQDARSVATLPSTPKAEGEGKQSESTGDNTKGAAE